jgi:hypothetical protein
LSITFHQHLVHGLKKKKTANVLGALVIALVMEPSSKTDLDLATAMLS